MRSDRAFARNDVGLEQIDGGIRSIDYYDMILGRIDRKTGRITGPDEG